MREYLNNDWEYTDSFTEAFLSFEGAAERVRLPHTVVETPYDYFDETVYQKHCGYRRTFCVPKQWIGKRIFLTFEGAAHRAQVYVNEKRLAVHENGYTAFCVEVTEAVMEGENRLVVELDSRENLNQPPFGFVIDYMTYGGLYRDVWLEVQEPDFVKDVFIRTPDAKKGADCVTLRVSVTLDIRNGKGTDGGRDEDDRKDAADKKTAARYTVCQRLLTTDGRLLAEWRHETDRMQFTVEYMLPLAQSGQAVQTEHTAQPKQAAPGMLSLWEPDNPVLYVMETELPGSMERRVTRFGVRSACFLQDGFYLNGEKIKLRGVNRHQSFPYVGYAMPQSMQRRDAFLIKEELACNAVRTSHYPQSQYFLDCCDEIGLFVFTEIPGWQHIGDAEWKEKAVQNTREMVLQNRNHPSVILWGVRINESHDDDAFYQRTNEAAHALDDSRQTGGVRALKKSTLLEDVYTYNDFLHDGGTPGCEPKRKVTPDVKKAYLVSEYNGHMYPTKAFDCEKHRQEHALRHANVLEAVAANEDIAGSFAWCMFDYNTHQDFGSGDRICYHGLMDMYRNPKLAAAVYASQGEGKVVLEAGSSMDIGEHPGCNRGDLYLFSNADSIRMYKNDRLIKEYTKEDSPYRHLAHGPILIDDFIGDRIAENEPFTPAQAALIKKALNLTARNGLSHMPAAAKRAALWLMLRYHMKPQEAVTLYNRYIGDWGGTATSYRFEAIKGGKVVKTVIKKPMSRVVLWTDVDHVVLREGVSYDTAAVRIRATDEYGNVLPYFQEPVTLWTEGPIRLIGPEVISLRGGMGGTYVRTTGECGEAELILVTPHAEEVQIAFRVERQENVGNFENGSAGGQIADI